MKKRFFRIGSGLLAGVAALAALLTASSAQNVTRNIGAFDNGLTALPILHLDAKVKMVEAANILIDVEPISLAEVFPFIDESVSLTKQAFVSVRGLPGETVVMTCRIETRDKDIHSGAHKVRNRDCDGNAAVAYRTILSGTRQDNEIRLTNDLLSNPRRQTDNSISIEVTYI